MLIEVLWEGRFVPYLVGWILLYVEYLINYRLMESVDLTEPETLGNLSSGGSRTLFCLHWIEGTLYFHISTVIILVLSFLSMLCCKLINNIWKDYNINKTNKCLENVHYFSNLSFLILANHFDCGMSLSVLHRRIIIKLWKTHWLASNFKIFFVLIVKRLFKWNN